MRGNQSEEGEVLVAVRAESEVYGCASTASQKSDKGVVMHFFIIQCGPKRRESDECIAPTSAHVCDRNELSGREVRGDQCEDFWRQGMNSGESVY